MGGKAGFQIPREAKRLANFFCRLALERTPQWTFRWPACRASWLTTRVDYVGASVGRGLRE